MHIQSTNPLSREVVAIRGRSIARARVLSLDRYLHRYCFIILINLTLGLIMLYTEELGEGDLKKNHIKIYKDLLEEIG